VTPASPRVELGCVARIPNPGPKEDGKMTDQTATAPHALANDQEEEGPDRDFCELARNMRLRCAGFALLLENMAEIGLHIEDDDFEAVARLARDIAEKAAELHECARLDFVDAINAANAKKGIFP
jgi:hypothetical protein